MSRLGLAILGLPLVLAPRAVHADGDRGDKAVRPGQALSEILAREPGAAPASGARPSHAMSGRSAGMLAGALILSAAGIVFLRRRRARGAAAGPGGPVRVEGRVAITHRHAVFLVRVDGARIVVGLTGDRMTPLAVLEDPAGGEESLRHRSGRPPHQARPADADRRGRLDPEELDRYRKQVDRLKVLLQGPLRNAAREMGGER